MQSKGSPNGKSYFRDTDVQSFPAFFLSRKQSNIEYFREKAFFNIFLMFYRIRSTLYGIRSTDTGTGTDNKLDEEIKVRYCSTGTVSFIQFYDCLCSDNEQHGTYLSYVHTYIYD